MSFTICQTLEKEILFEQLHPTEKKLYLKMHELQNKFNNVLYHKQETLAAYIGITREWANKLLKRLETKGFVRSIYRGVKRSKEYLCTPLFNATARRLEEEFTQCLSLFNYYYLFRTPTPIRSIYLDRLPTKYIVN